MYVCMCVCVCVCLKNEGMIASTHGWMHGMEWNGME